MNSVRLPTSPHWNRAYLSAAPPAEWQQIVTELCGALAELFGADVECEPVRDTHNGDYVSVGFLASLLSLGALKLTVAGILTISTESSERSPNTSVSMVGFLFSGERRLVQSYHKGDFFDAQFLSDGVNAAVWSSLRWRMDGYGEWEGCVTPRSVFG